MKRKLLRMFCMILCFCMSFTMLPVTEVQAVSDEEYYRDMVLEHYSESFAYSNYFQGLTNENGYLYKQWADNVEKKTWAEKSYMWVVQTLLGKQMNQEAYVDYLCSLMSMLENGFSESVAAQASYTAKLSAFDYIEGITEIAGSDLLPVIRKKELRIACEHIGASADLLDEMISDVKQIGVVATASTLYEQKVMVLQAIKENTSDARLRSAADDLIATCDYELLAILGNYADNIAGELVSLDCDLLDTSSFKAICSVLMRPQLRERIMTKITAVISADTLAKLSKAFSCVGVGFTIGVNTMKIVYSEDAEYYREMQAMNTISDALIPKLSELKKLADSTGDETARFAYIKEYEAVAKALLFTHLRGEYCNVESRKDDEAEAAESYYSKVVTMLHGYEEVIASIMAEEKLFVVNDVFTLHDGFIKKVMQKTEVPDGYVGIYSYEDLQGIIDHQPEGRYDFNEYNTGKYILMSDITLPDGYEPMRSFAGVFDGNGYCISNIQQPLFSTIVEAEIRNLALKVNYVKDLEDEEAAYGALARVTGGFTKDGKSVAYGSNVKMNVIDNCYVTGYINIQFCNGYVGGLIGNALFMEISNCYNEAGVAVRSRQSCDVGGIVGYNGELTNCFNTGAISGYATAENTIYAWSIELNTGGIGGHNIEAEYCYNTGSVSASAAYICRVVAGGIMGRGALDCNVRNCYNTGSVKSESDYPADKLDKILKDEEEYLKADWSRFAAGGIVGFTNCWDTGKYDEEGIVNCWNDGTVAGRHFSGGIVGLGSTLLVSNCCNTGSVSGGGLVGGLAGSLLLECPVSYCYNAGDVSGGTQTGSLAGNLDNAAEAFVNCYYLTGGLAATSFGASYEGAKELSQEQMTDAQYFEGFDFRNIWVLKEGAKRNTPMLRFKTLDEE